MGFILSNSLECAIAYCSSRYTLLILGVDLVWFSLVLKSICRITWDIVSTSYYFFKGVFIAFEKFKIAFRWKLQSDSHSKWICTEQEEAEE